MVGFSTLASCALIWLMFSFGAVFISFFEDVVYINSSDNRILVLKQSDLSLDEVISP